MPSRIYLLVPITILLVIGLGGHRSAVGIDAVSIDAVGIDAVSAKGGAELFVDSGQALGTSSTYGVALGDLDGDGDLDAFSAINVASNRVWINQGGAQGGVAGIFADSGQSLGADDSREVALGDLDGDGDLDAFVVNGIAAGDRVWINQGGAQGGTAGIFADSGQSLGNGDGAAASLADLDGDGDLDALAAGGAGVEVWTNQGGSQGGTEGAFSAGASFGSNVLEIALGDLDGDGDPDAFLARAFGPAALADQVWINDGAGSFSNSDQSLGSTASHAVGLADFDGDLDLDAFVGAGAGDGDRIWFNQGGAQGGSAGFFSDSGQSLGATNSRDVAVADFDGDGDLDAFVANLSGADVAWINDGTGAFVDSGQALGFDLSAGVAAGPLDGDDRPDVFVAAFGPNRVWWAVGSGQALGYFGNPETIAAFDRQLVIDAGDLDGDGDLDLIELACDGEGVTWINQGGIEGLFVAGDPLPVLPESFAAPRLGDVDGDGDLDAFVALWSTEADGFERIWLNDGSARFVDSGQQLDGGAAGRAAFFDAERDGDLDVVTAGSPNRLFINQGGVQGGAQGSFAASGQPLGSAGFHPQTPPTAAVAAGDVDGDGDVDLALLDEGQVGLWVNQGGIQAGSEGIFVDSGQRLGWRGNSYTNHLAIGDLDGDGDPDLLTTGHFGRVVLHLNDGSGSFDAPGPCLARGVYYVKDVVSGDFDGFPGTDFVLGTDTDTGVSAAMMTVWLGDGLGGLYSNGQCLNGPGSRMRAFDLASGDFDNDGDLDLVSAGRDGLLLWRNGSSPAGNRCCSGEYSTIVETGEWDPNIEQCVIGSSLGRVVARGGSADGQIDLSTFRRIRDELLPQLTEGQRWLDFYQQHDLEVLTLLMFDSGLRADGLEALDLWQDDLAALVGGNGSLETVSAEEIDAVEVFLTELQITGSAELSAAITAELAALPPLVSFVGLSVEEASALVGGPSIAIFADGFESGTTGAWSSGSP